MHAVTTWELGKSDKKIKIKLLDPPLSEFPVQGIGGGGGLLVYRCNYFKKGFVLKITHYIILHA